MDLLLHVIEHIYSITYNKCMPAFQRAQVATLSHRLGEAPSRIIAVFGPRQTGKTTIVRQALGQIPQQGLYLAVDEPVLTP